MKQGYWYAFTPGGSICMETGAKTEQECATKLLTSTAHMPYKTLESLEARGYEICKINGMMPHDRPI